MQVSVNDYRNNIVLEQAYSYNPIICPAVSSTVTAPRTFSQAGSDGKKNFPKTCLNSRDKPWRATIRLAMQSGTLVPAARNVMPIITSGIPSVYPMMVT